MERGSPRGYIAETGGGERPAQKPQKGEPHERPLLYRIRRSQEKCELLREDGQWRDCAGGQVGGPARGAAGVGSGASTTLAGCDGSDTVQRLDLRYPEALRAAVGHGASGADEGHHRGQEEERSPRRPHHCRPVALQPAARLLRVVAADARSAAAAALSPSGGGRVGAHAEQDGWPTDGDGRALRKKQIE